MPEKDVRVRFAPSPTGPLHIGGVRTALFNYLFAKKNNGTFILRIEDTDQTRTVEGAEDYIIESLKWCGIEPDEGIHEGGSYGPYRQSERKSIYREYAIKLVQDGFAYYAFDTQEELEVLRKKCEAEKKTFTYDASVRNELNNSLNADPDEVTERIRSGEPYVIRFRIPEDEEITFKDVVRGEVRVNSSTLDDKVLFKADGMPTYHLANVVDDHLMQVSHVIRGEEWLPSTPLHVLLYRAFGWEREMPVLAHMPLTLKPDGKGKLSKRDGDRLGFPVFPLQWQNPKTGEVSSGYRESGYFPEAFINILALLGWNPGTEKELYSMEELVEDFSIERIIKSGSRFDPEKARWFNHQYMLKKTSEELAEWFIPFIQKRGMEADRNYTATVVDLIKERAFLLPDLWEHSWFFFLGPVEYDEKVIKKAWNDDSGKIIQDIRVLLENLVEFEGSLIESEIKNFVQSNEIGFGKVMNPLRLLLTGSNTGPGLLDMMEILGKEEVLKRIDSGLKHLV